MPKTKSSTSTEEFESTDSRSKAGQPLARPGTYEGNPIHLPRDVAEPIIKHLDRHLATLWAMWHQYRKHHWLVVGPQFRDLHLFLEELYGEVANDGDAVAERITALGGIPTSGMKAQLDLLYITEEPEGRFHIRDSLRHDMSCEGTVALNLRKTMKECADHGDFGTRHLLEKVLLKAEDRAHHLQHFLEDDSLEIGRGKD